MQPRVCMHEHFDLITNPFKYKCETYNIFIHPFQKNCDECNMQHLNNSFNKFKMINQLMYKCWQIKKCEKIH